MLIIPPETTAIRSRFNQGDTLSVSIRCGNGDFELLNRTRIGVLGRVIDLNHQWLACTYGSGGH